MKITIYELLGLIKDGKAPKNIKYDDMIWEYDGDYYSSKNNIILEEYCNLTTSLNDEVEIIEEQKEHKIPEKLNISNFPRHNNSLKKTAIKLNEILDYLEEIE